MGKYSTSAYQSQRGPFQVHYYYESTTGNVMYDFDYKVVRNPEVGGNDGHIHGR
jgi:hypothetical protein